MSETTTWKHCCECRRRFAFYAEIDKSRCYECELKRKAYREGYEAFRREMVEALREKAGRLHPERVSERLALADLSNAIASGTLPPKPKEGT